MAPRGRPRKVASAVADSSSAPSRTRSSVRTSPQQKIAPPPAKKTRLSNTKSTTIKDSEDDSMDELSPAKPATKKSSLPTAKPAIQVNAPQSRASLSSISTLRNSAESSRYSTPGTSLAATPAAGTTEISVIVPSTSSTGGIGIDMDALDADLKRQRDTINARLAQRRKDGKRKRQDSDQEEEEEVDNHYDASVQLAKALQREEDGKANYDASLELAKKLQKKEDRMANSVSLGSSPRSRNSSRPLRPVMPKSPYVLDSYDDEDDDEEMPIPSSTARSRKKANTWIADSDGDDDIYDSSDIPPTTRPSKKSKSTPAKLRGPFPSSTGQSKGRGRPSKATASPKSTAASSKSSKAKSIPNDDESHEGSVHNSDDTGSESSSRDDDSDGDDPPATGPIIRPRARRGRARMTQEGKSEVRARRNRERLETHHPELQTMWKDLENLTEIPKLKAEQPTTISRELKPFQLEGLYWMQQMEKTEWAGGLLGDEMGMGKTIQAVSLIMSDYPAKNPSLVLVPPVALMQWQQEMGDYTNGKLKTFVYHGTTAKLKDIKLKDLKGYDVILMSYNSLESMFRGQEKGRQKNGKTVKVKSVIHQIRFHRIILDEAHCIKQRTSGTAKACFALTADHKWCLSGTPLQNRIGEFFSLIRFLSIQPFACYLCKACPCSRMEWGMDSVTNRCTDCNHASMQHVSVFNQELLTPIQKHGNEGPGKIAFDKLHLLTNRFMLRRVKKDHSSSMELPSKEIFVDRHFFGEVENDFAGSIMNNSSRKFETYVSQGIMLRNYANIFGLIMQMRQVADHPDLILKKNVEGGQNVLVCCVCDEPAEDPVRSQCKHDFCRSCVKSFIATAAADSEYDARCPRCHIALSVDLEQAAVAQDEAMVKKNSIINRIKMENWTSSSKIEALVYDLHELRSRNSSCKSIIFSQFTSMLQLVEWRLHRAGISTVMLDGSMTPAQRQASINHFMTDVDVECFLVSLKAGGVALNLTEASKVFIIDPWWNPAAEWQSADRCHRIGQTRPCSITRLCIEDSVESRMVLLQEKKANMINSTINNDSSAMESLTVEDMQFLFRGS